MVRTGNARLALVCRLQPHLPCHEARHGGSQQRRQAARLHGLPHPQQAGAGTGCGGAKGGTAGSEVLHSVLHSILHP